MPAKVTSFISVISAIFVEAVDRCTRIQHRVNRLHTSLRSQPGSGARSNRM